MKQCNTLPLGYVLKSNLYNYKIEKVLGQGAFGITYLASIELQGGLGNLESNIHVTIKEFFMKEISGREGTSVTSSASSKGGLFYEYKEKFAREAKNLSKLKHPNIVNVMEFFEANNTCYYVMEYLSGGDLDSLIEHRGRLSEADTLRYTKQIAEALSFMHENKMLHLDLKPKNVMLNANGEAILIDFGLSKQYDKSGEPESSTTVGRGTPGYAPLEQANYQDGHGFPVTMDVYALGATMYKMLTGKRAPEASVILNEEFPQDSFNSVNCSKATLACIIKAMEPLKRNRYNSIGTFLQALPHGNNHYDVNNEETTVSNTKEKKHSTDSVSIKMVVEDLIASGQYREAYNMCLAAVKKDSNNEYAMKRIQELVPLLKDQSKKDKRKHWVMAIIISIVGFILTVLAAIIQN